MVGNDLMQSGARSHRYQPWAIGMHDIFASCRSSDSKVFIGRIPFPDPHDVVERMLEILNYCAWHNERRNLCGIHSAEQRSDVRSGLGARHIDDGADFYGLDGFFLFSHSD